MLVGVEKRREKEKRKGRRGLGEIGRAERRTTWLYEISYLIFLSSEGRLGERREGTFKINQFMKVDLKSTSLI